METIRYIDNNIQLGIAYDWKKILRAYKALKCPKDVYDPVPAVKTMTIDNNIKWYIGMSKRRVGKTTNFLLIGIIMYWMYGTHTYYVRDRDDNIAPKNSRKMFDTIIAHNYIEIITDGQYNSVEYRAKAWYLVLRNDNGDIIDECSVAFCYMQSIQSADDVKSVLNDPLADLIIYDEFIGKYLYPNQFVDFFNLISTIKRLRQSCIIIMLANVIDMYHIYFKELCIADHVQKMRAGDKAVITTELGTKVYVERIEQPAAAKRQDEIDKVLYYGFPNPKLASITGDDWAIANYQHIPEGDVELMFNRIYIKYSTKYVRLDVVHHPELGLCIYAHWATYTYDDSIILTSEERTDKRYRFKFGHGRLEQILRKAFQQNRVYYATNDVGAFVESYIGSIKRLGVY